MSRIQKLPSELSVAEMRERIEAGETVSHRGRIFRDVRDLPTEAENAVTLEEKRAALQALEGQHDERDAEIMRLRDEVRRMEAGELVRPDPTRPAGDDDLHIATRAAAGQQQPAGGTAGASTNLNEGATTEGNTPAPEANAPATGSNAARTTAPAALRAGPQVTKKTAASGSNAAGT